MNLSLPRMKLVKIGIFYLFLALSSTSFASITANSLEQYVEKLIDQGYKIVADNKLSKKQIHNRVSDLIKNNLYLDWMAKSALGRYRRNLNPRKITEFTNIYSDYIVSIYTNLFINYNDQKAKLNSIKKIANNMFLVKMDLIKAAGDSSPDFKMEYLIHELPANGKITYKIGDIIASGISILSSQQAEFSNIIAKDGVDALIERLKSKIN